jgi:hypothetical protein
MLTADSRIIDVLCDQLVGATAIKEAASDRKDKLSQFALHALALLVGPTGCVGKERASFPLATAVSRDYSLAHSGRRHQGLDIPRVKASRGWTRIYAYCYVYVYACSYL